MKNHPAASLMLACTFLKSSSTGSPMIMVVLINASSTINEPKNTGGFIAAPNNVFLSLLTCSLIDNFLIVNHGVPKYTVVYLLNTS